jgi:hypothetical protein
MTRLIQTAKQSDARFWLKDVAALLSIGAFLWVAGTWVQIAHAAMVG